MCYSDNPFRPFTLNIGGSVVKYTRPAVMGIINATPDSFYPGSRAGDVTDIARRASDMVTAGADMLDVGGYSSRPGGDDVPPKVETQRVVGAIRAIRSVDAAIPVSVDTFRAEVARAAVDAGANIVNDISGGALDAAMLDTVADMRVPYIAMHMRGTPATMQQLTDYGDVSVVQEVTTRLAEVVSRCIDRGIADIIVDPGFGFAKTLEQNYALLRGLPLLREALPLPVLVGVSRKSMITRLLGITAEEALVPTMSVNTMALLQGASILRVHDVKAAAQAVSLTQQFFRP